MQMQCFDCGNEVYNHSYTVTYCVKNMFIDNIHFCKDCWESKSERYVLSKTNNKDFTYSYPLPQQSITTTTLPNRQSETWSDMLGYDNWFSTTVGIAIGVLLVLLLFWLVSYWIF